MKKVKVKPYDAIPFVNDLGQTVNPNDKIIAVTTCRGSTSVHMGRYMGSRKHSSWRGKESVRVVVEYDKVRTDTIHKETGKRWDWGYVPPGMKRPDYPRANYRRDYNNYAFLSAADRIRKDEESRQESENYQLAVNKYNEDMKVYDAAIKEHRDTNYKQVKVPYITRSTLQYNRVYLTSTKFEEFVKS